MKTLEGKIALITGASRGIGAATAVRFAEQGAHLGLNYFRHEAEALVVAKQCRMRGIRAITVQADVSRFNDVRTLFETTVDEFGRVDIVVANAGIWTGDAVDVLDEDKWQQTIDVNLKGVYACCHFAAKLMKAQGSGCIITVSST